MAGTPIDGKIHATPTGVERVPISPDGFVTTQDIADLADPAIAAAVAAGVASIPAANITGVLGEAHIDALIARDTEVAAAIAAGVANIAGEQITSGLVADARIAATITRDSELAAAIAVEVADRNAAIAAIRQLGSPVGLPLFGAGFMNGVRRPDPAFGHTPGICIAQSDTAGFLLSVNGGRTWCAANAGITQQWMFKVVALQFDRFVPNQVVAYVSNGDGSSTNAGLLVGTIDVAARSIAWVIAVTNVSGQGTRNPSNLLSGSIAPDPQLASGDPTSERHTGECLAQDEWTANRWYFATQNGTQRFIGSSAANYQCNAQAGYNTTPTTHATSVTVDPLSTSTNTILIVTNDAGPTSAIGLRKFTFAGPSQNGTPASTTVGVGGYTAGAGSMLVGSTAGFATGGTLQTIVGITGTVSYTHVDATHLLGCSGGSGSALAGATVTATSGQQTITLPSTSTLYGLRCVGAEVESGATVIRLTDAHCVVGTITGGVNVALTTGTVVSGDTGKRVTGSGIPSGTTMTYVDATHFTLSGAATNASGVTIALQGGIYKHDYTTLTAATAPPVDFVCSSIAIRRNAADTATTLVVTHVNVNVNYTGPKVIYSNDGGTTWTGVYDADVTPKYWDAAGALWWLFVVAGNYYALGGDSGAGTSARSGGSYNHVIIDPVDPRIWMVAGRSGIWITRDAGDTWYLSADGLEVASTYDITVDTETGTAYMASSDFGVEMVRAGLGSSIRPANFQGKVVHVGIDGHLYFGTGFRDTYNSYGELFEHATPHTATYQDNTWTIQGGGFGATGIGLQAAAVAIDGTKGTGRVLGAIQGSDAGTRVLLAVKQNMGIFRGLGNSGGTIVWTRVLNKAVQTSSSTVFLSRFCWPNNGANVFAALSDDGAGGGGLWLSTDRGLSFGAAPIWPIVATTRYMGSVVADPDGNLWYSTVGGLWKITNPTSGTLNANGTTATGTIAATLVVAATSPGPVAIDANGVVYFIRIADDPSGPGIYSVADGVVTDLTSAAWVKQMAFPISAQVQGTNGLYVANQVGGYYKIPFVLPIGSGGTGGQTQGEAQVALGVDEAVAAAARLGNTQQVTGDLTGVTDANAEALFGQILDALVALGLVVDLTT